MSAAADNSVKQWLFDNADGSGRLLRFRSGHAAPPSCLRYYGDGTRLLSAGLPKAGVHLDAEDCARAAAASTGTKACCTTGGE